uniref:Small auxin up regulated protein n=1 Tax=Boehmeria nivea TaxID=83906 RepID=A0A172J241_BOENI|nr:small auxin up regulated protein [Boehmeria nivea]
MAKLRASSLSGKKKIINLNTIGTLAEKLQKGLSLVRSRSFLNDSNSVPNDVKEGHFAVIAAGGGDGPKRFVVPLRCLAHPTFRRLLERAAEEFGFDREGALTVPCRPCELERILADNGQHWSSSSRGGADEDSPAVSKWGPCNSMVQSY